MNNRTRALLAGLAVSGLLLMGLLLRISVSEGRPVAGPALPQAVPTVTPCPPPTPEALRVEPVVSPTDLLTQTIKVQIGNGRLVRVSGEGGAAEATAVANVAEVTVPLKPRAINNLLVEAEVYATGGPGGCTYNYTLSTRFDRNGAPLQIVQGEQAFRLPQVSR